MVPIIAPIIAGFKIIGDAIIGEASGLVTKNVAKTIWNIIKYLFIFVFIILISFLECITWDFFNNLRKYWKKDF